MKKINVLWVLCVCFLAGCKVQYSFTGASVSPDIQTVSVDFIENNAPLAPPTISQSFTEALKDVFISQSNLTLVREGGDLQFSGYISGYRNEPVAITGNETAALNRLTISVYITFVNQKEPEKNFTQTFSQFAEYSSSQNLSDVEESLIQEINKQLTQDIFNKALSNW
ncbi:MAG: hypothetical protein D6707_10930 [Bacteroidetes bacterium]|nr:MAG: hypothetical protein D6707_10930 [Bacteroidota bacterium]